MVSNLPHLESKWSSDVNNRESFFQIDTDLVDMLFHDLKPNELVAFLPYRNDAMVNYIAPKLGNSHLQHWEETRTWTARARIGPT